MKSQIAKTTPSNGMQRTALRAAADAEAVGLFVMMTIVKRISKHKVRIGGTQHSGWLPEGAAKPLPTPVREVLFNLEIQFDGSGYLLCYVSEEGDLYGDTWHETLIDAERAAAKDFSMKDNQWQDGSQN